MITKIELKNFMSHTSTVIEPAAGLTVLVGPNNCGKSAVVAALQILCHNDNSTYVLRHGEKACSIKIETDDGHTVEWRRKNSPSYVIDGQTFDRLKGAGLPEELSHVLRLPLVSAGNNQTFDVHFGEQKSPIFLLDQPGSCAASFFASSSDAISLVEMQRLHRTRVADAQRDKDRLEKDSKQLNDELDTLLTMSELDQTLREIEKEHTRLAQLGASIEHAARIEDQLRRTSVAMAGYELEASTFEALSAPPQLPASEPLASLCATLKNVSQAYAKCSGLEGVLAPLTDAPRMADSASLATLRDRIRAAEDDCATKNWRQGTVANLQAPPTLADEKSLVVMCAHLYDATTLRGRAGARRAALEQLPASPALADVAALRDLHQNLVWHLRCRDFHAVAQSAVNELEAPPLASDTHFLQRIIEQIGAAENVLDFAANRKELLTTLCDQPRFDLDALLETLVRSLRTADKQVAHWEMVTARLGSVNNLAVSTDTAPIEALIRSLRNAAQEITSFEAQFQQARAKFDEAEADLHAWAVDARICPTCGGDIDPDKLLAQTQHCGSRNHD